MSKRRRNGRRKGQVVVEVLLILPVFLTIVFTIMEIGYLAFWDIVINHATYECARIGSMIATPPDGGPPQDVTRRLQVFMNRMIRGAVVATSQETANSDGQFAASYYDNQAGVQNHDLVVTTSYNVPLVFPISDIILATPIGSGHRLLTATVRMPIEQPLPQ